VSFQSYSSTLILFHPLRKVRRRLIGGNYHIVWRIDPVALTQLVVIVMLIVYGRGERVTS
jgi:hypothetical protein